MADPNVRTWRGTPELCKFANLAGAAPVLAAECAAGERLFYPGIECDPGQVAQGALFEQRRAGDSWTSPQVVQDESCVSPPQSASAPQPRGDQGVQQKIDLLSAAAQAFQQMHIRPSDLQVQPPDGWTLVNFDTIVYADDEPQVIDTELFGIPVSIRAVPDTYTWDWGDGTTDSGTDPGAPYPDQTVDHSYEKPGQVSISLVTTWRGQFRVHGDAQWRQVPGEATTTSTSPPLDVREARTRLVGDLSS